MPENGYIPSFCVRGTGGLLWLGRDVIKHNQMERLKHLIDLAQAQWEDKPAGFFCLSHVCRL